jgi:outer membrane protein
MKRILILFSLIMTSASFLNAQTTWTLQSCIDYALANNILIKQQELSEQLAKVNLLQSKTSLFPSLNANASHAYNYGKTIDMYTNSFATERVQSDNFYISSSVTLFSGFQLLNTVKQNKIDLQASQYDLDKMMNDISLNLATAYLQILYCDELLGIAQNQLTVTEKQVARTQKLVDAGTVSKGTLLTLQAQQSTEELSVVNAQNNLDIAYLTITQMLDLPSADSFNIQVPTLDVSTESTLLLTPDQIYAYAVGTQPEIKSAELKVQSSELGLAIVQGMRYPTLSLRGSYGTGYSGASKRVKDITFTGYLPSGFTGSGDTVYSPSFDYNYENIPFSDQFNDNINKSISFSLYIPIFNGWQTNATVSKAKIAIQNSEYTLLTAKNTLYKSIQQAYADALAALNKYKSSSKSVDAYKEAFKYAEQKFEVGLVNSTEYDDAKNKLAEAESTLLQSKYEYVFRLKILDFYMGKPIELK